MSLDFTGRCFVELETFPSSMASFANVNSRVLNPPTSIHCGQKESLNYEWACHMNSRRSNEIGHQKWGETDTVNVLLEKKARV